MEENESTPGTGIPLRIAVLGAGSIGSAFAFQLARRGGHDVTVIARPGSARLAQLRRDNGIVDVKGERADLHVAEALDEQVAYDLVIVTLLAHQAGAVLPALQRSAARWIQFMFNDFEPERSRDAVGAQRCSFGMPFVQSQLDEQGRLKATIGAGGQKTKMSAQRWVDVFEAAGLPAVREPNMLAWLRSHAPLCIAFESVSVAGVRRGGGASWGEAMRIARGVQESAGLIRALGHPVYPPGKARLMSGPPWIMASGLWAASRVKSFRELLATGAVECGALVDELCAAAARSGAHIRTDRLQGMKPVPASPRSA